MKIRARKRYWCLYLPLVTVFTCGVGLLLFPVAYLLDKSMAKAAYSRLNSKLPPSWYDGMSIWEFEQY